MALAVKISRHCWYRDYIITSHHGELACSAYVGIQLRNDAESRSYKRKIFFNNNPTILKFYFTCLLAVFCSEIGPCV